MGTGGSVYKGAWPVHPRGLSQGILCLNLDPQTALLQSEMASEMGMFDSEIIELKSRQFF
jgi:hypothetical protein